MGSIKVQLDWILATSFCASWITMGISSAALGSVSAISRSLRFLCLKIFVQMNNKEITKEFGLYTFYQYVSTILSCSFLQFLITIYKHFCRVHRTLKLIFEIDHSISIELIHLFERNLCYKKRLQFKIFLKNIQNLSWIKSLEIRTYKKTMALIMIFFLNKRYS